MKIIKLFSVLVFPALLISNIISCSQNKKHEVTNFENLKINLTNHYKNWYDNLSYKEWDKLDDGSNKNAFCDSEQQALYLYANQWGDFWNAPLHNKEIPRDTTRKMFVNSGFKENIDYEIRGKDYHFITSALEKAKTPDFDLTVYHGVEWMEKEFYSQLYIYNEANGSLNFSKTIGKTIESYGFLSTSIDKKYAYPFVNGNNWNTGKNEPPLKEPALFIINIKNNTNGAAYLSSSFSLMGIANKEEQVLINKDTKFKITNWEKDKAGVNIFTMDLIR